MAEVRMPKMGDGMVEGTILRWMKREGESIAVNEAIAEIETDKANVEMTAEEGGTLTKILVKEGETVPVGAVIAHIGEVGAQNGAGSDPVQIKPDRIATDEAGTSPADVTPMPQAPSDAEPASERVKASPLARRMAGELGLDLAMIKGTGPGGRIVERDIAAAQERQPRGGVTMPAVAAEQAARPATTAPSLAGQDVELSKMRKAIARRTVQSKQTVPHIYLTMPIEMDAAIELLERLNAGATEGKITINDLILKACAAALVKFPAVNVSFTPDEKVRKYDTINIGFAVATDEALYIPVIPDCGGKTLRQISAEARALATKARAGALSPAEMSSGTFSVSNLGMFGIEEFAAIINPPESAILAIGAALPEVTVDAAGSFVVRRKMRVTLSCDHRTVDGLLGARFLQELKRLLETPMQLLSWS